jgi:hypothetical protein
VSDARHLMVSILGVLHFTEYRATKFGHIKS